MTAPAVLAAAAVPHGLALYLPLLALGAAAGLLYTLAQRSRTRRARLGLQLAWIALLLAGGPLWLLVAAAMGWL